MAETMQQMKPSLVSKAYDGGSEFQNTWEKMSKKDHIYWLSQPSKKALRPYPDPKFYTPVPRPITKAALNFQPTERIILMSTPKKDKITQKWEKQEFKDTTQVEPAALLAVASPRLIELARPHTASLKKKSTSKGKKLKRLKRKQKGIKRTAEQKEAWLLRCSAPKKWPPPHHPHPNKPRFVMRGSKQLVIKERKRFTVPQRQPIKLSKSELQNRMTHLSIPSKRRTKFRWSMEKDDYAERRAKIIARMYSPFPNLVKNPIIDKLATRKMLPEEARLDLEFKPFKISRAALSYKATARITELAVAVKKKERLKSDVKEDPFKVLPRALKAMPTPNQERLAQPKIINDDFRPTKKKMK